MSQDPALDRHVAFASDPEYHGDPLTPRDFARLWAVGAAVPLAILVLGRLIG